MDCSSADINRNIGRRGGDIQNVPVVLVFERHERAGFPTGRASDDQITLFESLGVAIWDIAAANYIYDQCLKTGRGREVDIPS